MTQSKIYIQWLKTTPPPNIPKWYYCFATVIKRQQDPFKYSTICLPNSFIITEYTILTFTTTHFRKDNARKHVLCCWLTKMESCAHCQAQKLPILQISV